MRVLPAVNCLMFRLDFIFDSTKLTEIAFQFTYSKIDTKFIKLLSNIAVFEFVDVVVVVVVFINGKWKIGLAPSQAQSTQRSLSLSVGVRCTSAAIVACFARLLLFDEDSVGGSHT